MFCIVTPVKNGVRFIPTYLKSLLSQTFPDWHAIIVDDGSTDDSYQLLLDLCSSDSRFTVLRNMYQPSVRGPYAARNYALSQCNMEYICFLDIDDFWLPDKLSELRDRIVLDSYPDLLYSSYFRSDFNSLKSVYVSVLSENVARRVIAFANPFPMLTACVKHSVIRNLPFRPLNHEDYHFWHELISNSSLSLVSYQSVCSIYRSSPSSLSRKNFWSNPIWMYRSYRYRGVSFLGSFVLLFCWFCYHAYTRVFLRTPSLLSAELVPRS